MAKIRDKILDLIWPIAFIGMVLFISFSAITIFNNNFYSLIFVEGDSMNPTLTGDDNHADYGKMDTSSFAIQRIKRFDIVITYYPNEDYVNPYDPTPGAVNTLKENATFKIKRVYALPGETFSLEEVEIDEQITPVFKTYQGELATVHEFDFSIRHTNRTISKTRVNDQQLYVMGDNWTSSRDSYTRGPIYVGNVVGVLYCIEGYGIINKSQTPHTIENLVKGETTYYQRG